MPFSGLIPYADPFHAGRHPMQLFLLALCIVAGVPLLAGRVPATSIEATLPLPLAIAWGAALTLGAAIALLGAYWPPARGLSSYSPNEAGAKLLDAVTIERIGLGFTGIPALVYGPIAVTYGGAGGAVTAGLAVGFGLACLRRVRDIRRLLQRAQDLGDGTEEP